jgi:hypothetical protein
MEPAAQLNLGPHELAGLFGGDTADVAQWCASYLDSCDLGYRRLAQDERNEMILAALLRLDSDAASAAGADRLPNWEDGWTENLKEFIASGYDVDSLVPKYIQPNQTIRLLGDYAKPTNANFIRDYIRIYRAWLTRRFLFDAAAVYEFGCGPGSHVAYLAQSLPGKAIVGLDWAAPSQKILAAMAEHYGWTVTGHHFDFFAPDPAIRLPADTAVLTVGALEQVGCRHGAFLEYLLANRPLRCVHVEGFNELYDSTQLFDYLALRYHKKRNYLWNFLTRLRELESEARLVIEFVHRHRLGTRFDDTFSCVVWRPV